jgi:hypothetical protein
LIVRGRRERRFARFPENNFAQRGANAVAFRGALEKPRARRLFCAQAQRAVSNHVQEMQISPKFFATAQNAIRVRVMASSFARHRRLHRDVRVSVHAVRLRHTLFVKRQDVFFVVLV